MSVVYFNGLEVGTTPLCAARPLTEKPRAESMRLAFLREALFPLLAEELKDFVPRTDPPHVRDGRYVSTIPWGIEKERMLNHRRHFLDVV